MIAIERLELLVVVTVAGTGSPEDPMRQVRTFVDPINARPLFEYDPEMVDGETKKVLAVFAGKTVHP